MATPARAAEALLMLTGALLLASLGLVPGQSNIVFGAEVAAIGLVTLSVTLYNQIQPLPPVEGLTPLKRYLRALVSATATLPLVIGGILLMPVGRLPAFRFRWQRASGPPGFCSSRSCVRGL
jgi:hypothetical protein